MLKPDNLHDYQCSMVRHQLVNDDSMLWAGMGTGKTIATLTSIVERMRAGQVQKTLIIGPLRVIQSVWEQEARKWEHTKHLNFLVVHGNREKRAKKLHGSADIYLINYESLTWFVEQMEHYYSSKNQPLPFQMVVFDEISKMKNSASLRVGGGNRDRIDKKGISHKIKIRGWRTIMNLFQYRTGLTGTPASNGFLDLHGQFLIIDGGKRLGEYVTGFKANYFASDYMGWSYTPTEEGKKIIEHQIADITIKIDAKDYLDLPPVKFVNLMVDLPAKARRYYDEIEEDMFTKLDNGEELEVFSRASVSNKCLQISNGNAYKPESKEYEIIHDVKLEALDEVMEEAAGQPVLCSYSYKSDADRIMKAFKKYKPVNLTATSSAKTPLILEKWKTGNIKLMIGHAASMGHGIDGLQDRGHILVWFGLPWSLELYEQMNARLDRQGQTNTVTVIRILAKDTLDLAVLDALTRKSDDQDGLRASLDRYKKKLLNNEIKLDFLN